MYILHTALYIFPKAADEENLINNQEHILLVIISSILVI